MEKNRWADPNGFTMVLHSTKRKYARLFLEKGQIKFSTPASWVEYENAHGQGRGDRLEGTMATFNIFDSQHAIGIFQKYKKSYNDLLRIIDDDGRVYLKRERDMQLPCFCFYCLYNKMFACPQNLGMQELETIIPESYFKDLTDYKSSEKIEKLPEDEKPVLLIVEDYSEFKNRLISKLMKMGIPKHEILEVRIEYINFNQYEKYSWWDFGQKSPMELAIKHDRFKGQNEARFIINTDCQEVLQKLENPIEIGPLKDICGLCNFYFYNGAKVVMKAEIDRL